MADRSDSGSDRAAEEGGEGSRASGGLADRLREVLAGEAEGDLVLEAAGEDGVLRWLRALDLQVLGACRADERLKPMLKLSVSGGVAEERLVAQLNQHFEASEVGMLARCLCIPLVSIRVGKVYKQENLLCPSSSRGHLNLSLLPSSTMRISFTGDDGCIERLAVVATDSESTHVIIEEISADTSGRSFLLKLPGSQVSYFWCSERSKPHGMELLSKMKDLLKNKPSLSDLTGISESRIDSFANHMRSSLFGSSTQAEAISNTSMSFESSLHAANSDLHSSSRPLRTRLTASHSAKVHPFYQGSLSPRPSTFKDGMPKVSLSSRNARDKQKRRGDSHPISLANNVLLTSATRSASAPCTSQSEDNSTNIESCSDYSCFTPCCLPEIPCLSYPLPSCSHSIIKAHQSPFTASSPSINPCYSWYPPYPSPLQYMVSSHLPVASVKSLPLPPLSSLLSSNNPPVSVIPSELPIDIAGLPSHKLPSIFPETLVHFPRCITSHSTLPSSHSQQIPTFTQFISDPIVHIPIIDVCSAGQGYLVSAESAISLTVPPLLPTCAIPLMSQTESVQMNARETLRMLMAAAPTSSCPPFMTMLPQVLKSSGENFPYANVINRETIPSGSRGLYSGILDVTAVTSGFSLMLSSSAQTLVHEDLETRISSESPEGLDFSEIGGGSSCSEGNLSDKHVTN